MCRDFVAKRIISVAAWIYGGETRYQIREDESKI